MLLDRVLPAPLALAALAAAAITAPAEAQPHPLPQVSALGSPARLLVIDLDDVGYDLLRETPTPTLDALERNGRFFTAFTTAPICSPTRAMFNTGAYPSHPDLLTGEVVFTSSPFSMPTAPLEPLATLITAAGYSTAKIGKWHLAGIADTDHPRRCGWGLYAGVLSNLIEPNQSFAAYPKIINGQHALGSDDYLTTDETNDAIRCVEAEIDLISVSYHAPHRPWHTPPAHLHSIDPINTDRDRARAMLQACDTELRRLLAAALPRGYTVVVFADNGTARPIGGQKGWLLDGGVINPMWAFGPGVVPGVDDSRVGVVDLYATIAEFFGVPAGAGSGFEMRGPQSSSFLRALGGVPIERRWSYSERFPQPGTDPRVSGVHWRRMVRGERFKLTLAGANAAEMKFVDLLNDPYEQTNLLDPPVSLSPMGRTAYTWFSYVLTRL